MDPSENADFAECVENSGFVFVVLKAETIRLMGDKVLAIRVMNSTRHAVRSRLGPSATQQPEESL